MTNANTLPFQRKHHPLSMCAHCGATSGLYITYLLSTRSMAALCEDFISCLRNQEKKRLT